MAQGDIIPYLGEIARNTRKTSNILCGTPYIAITSAGTGNIPAGYNSVSIAATTVPATVTMSDGSVYTFTVVGESFSQAAAEGGKLPTYIISSGAVKWIGVK